MRILRVQHYADESFKVQKNNYKEKMKGKTPGEGNRIGSDDNQGDENPYGLENDPPIMLITHIKTMRSNV